MEFVIERGLTLPGVTASTHYGAQALKLRGHMLACTAINKSAEANSAVVAIPIEQRTALLNKHPSLYYITDHYAPYPSVLIRLAKISRVELDRVLGMAWEFVAAKPARSRARRTSGTLRRRRF